MPFLYSIIYDIIHFFQIFTIFKRFNVSAAKNLNIILLLWIFHEEIHQLHATKLTKKQVLLQMFGKWTVNKQKTLAF